MTRWDIHGLTGLPCLAACIAALLCVPAVARGSPAVAEGAHRCVVLDDERRGSGEGAPAGKVASALNVGEPRTVRMIYFLPNDRPYRQSVADTMKAMIVRLQAWFGQQMASHGYGYMTFRYEADENGEPVVHRVDGAHGDAYYLKETSGPVERESWPYAGHAHVYFAVVDNSTGLLHSRYGAAAGVGSGGKNGGSAIVGAGSGFALAAHELTHAFGLMWHDFRDDTYILSYGMDRRSRLSACSARHLSVSPFFNPEISYDNDRSLKPTIEYIGPTRWYAPGTQRFTLPWRVSDPDGIHLVMQWVHNTEDNQLALQVKACRAMDGETEAMVAFEYDGVIPQLRHSSFAYPAVHAVPARAVDTQGYSRSSGPVDIAQASPHHLATLKGQASRPYIDVAFSPDGGLLASASWDTTVKLWDTETWVEIATLHGHTDNVKSAAFSPDGGILASGSTDSTVRVWDVAARQEIAVLDRHTDTVFSVAFSPDGGKLAARSQLGRVDLWDVLCEEIVAQLTVPGVIWSISFSPDGSLLAASMGYGIELWDTSSFTSRRSRAPDWDGDGAVGFGDFVKFAAKFGFSRGEVGYDPRFDLDRDGNVGFSDFLILDRAFGQSG